MSNLFSGIESQDLLDILLQGILAILTPSNPFLIPDLDSRILAHQSQGSIDQRWTTRETIQSPLQPRVSRPTAQQVVLCLEVHTAYHLVQ